jgi:RNase H-fold protein (predicted Holliday junction resolvase)
VTVLGIDPGTRKCGYAVIVAGATVPAALGIAPTTELAEHLRAVLAQTPADVVAMGGGTHVGAVSAVVQTFGLPIELVDERETTLRARARFFVDHPPRGWRRLVPRGMLLPDRPIDDYAALLIAQRYLASRSEGEE